MPRRREVPKREILPDPKFRAVDLSKFLNVIMDSGKKAVAERIIYGALAQVDKKSGTEPLAIFIMVPASRRTTPSSRAARSAVRPHPAAAAQPRGSRPPGGWT